MRVSIRTKVSVFVTVIIVAISAVSTFLFISAHKNSKEKGRVSRGTALSYALSKAAEEGLLAEDLDLLKKAGYIVRTEDVVLSQVYSDIWEPLESHPFEQLKAPPLPEAISHFEGSAEPLYLKVPDGYDFYTPIFFRVSVESPPMTIGYVRVVLSSTAINKEIGQIVVTNSIVAALITALAILSINMLISRLVLKPILSLHKSVSLYRQGVFPKTVPVHSDDEIGDLSEEFNAMSLAIGERAEKLIESEKRIKSLFERVEHAIFGLDRDGNIIEANGKFLDMFGSAKSICTLLMSEQKGVDCINDALAGNVIQAEERVMGKRGNELDVLISIYPERDEKGGIEGFDGYIIDITEKKALEEQLRHAQKMEVIGTLTSGVAHEYNNILTAIIGFSEILDEDLKSSSLRRYVKLIRESADRAAKLTAGLLAYCRKQITHPEPIEINSAVRAIEGFLTGLLGENIRLSIVTHPGDLVVTADKAQFEQVILNLATNARDAMPDGGSLIISSGLFEAEGETLDRQAHIQPGRYALISVTDTGAGIDEETLSRIFEPFFTTKDIGKGTGLGLSIVYGTIKRHGGHIAVESALGRGTTFRIYLPLGGVLQRGEKQRPPVPSLKGSGNVLLAEDDFNVRALMKEVLEKAGYKVTEAVDGADAVSKYHEKRGGFDILLFDIAMPGKSGVEAYEEIRRTNPEVRALFVSGYATDSLPSVGSGRFKFIPKPVTQAGLLSAVKEIAG